MLETGLEGALFAVLAAVFGLAQALLFPHRRGLQARFFDVWTIYFGGHFVFAIVLFCIWKIPSSLSNRNLAFQLLLECAWIEGMAVMMCMCLRIVYTDPTLHAMFCCVTVVTVVLHLPGFVLLVLDQDNGRSILFGASLLIPTSLLVAFVQIYCSEFDKGPRPITIGVYSLLNICGLVCLTAIQNADKFLQANVILITITNLIPFSLRLFKSSRVSEEIPSHHSRQTSLTRGMRRGSRGPEQASDDFLTDSSQPSGTAKRRSDGWDTLSLSSKQGTSKSDESLPPSLLNPPAPTYSILSEQPAYQLNPITIPATPIADAGAIYVTTEVDVTVNTKQGDDPPELESWVFADTRKRC